MIKIKTDLMSPAKRAIINSSYYLKAQINTVKTNKRIIINPLIILSTNSNQ